MTDSERLVSCLRYDLRATRDTLVTMGAFMLLDAGGGVAHLEAWRSMYGSGSVRDIADALAKLDDARRYGRPVLAAVYLPGAP